MKLSSFFKPSYKYPPFYYLGRKQVQQLLETKIIKFKKLNKLEQQSRNIARYS